MVSFIMNTKVNRQRLEEILAIQNPWWLTNKVKKEKTGNFERLILSEIYRKTGGEKIVSIIGPRRTGKTVLIHQLIQKLLENGVDAKHICYLSCDNPNILGDNLLDEITDLSSNLIGKPVEDLETPLFVFLDEIHKLDTWGEQVKHWHDLGLKIKFVVSGSSALRILKGSGESLLGRIDHTILLQLSFREFLSVKYGLTIKPFGFETNEIKKNYYNLITSKHKIQIAFNDYLHKGGYPATITKNIDEVFQMLLEYKDLSIHRDIFEIEEIRDTKTLNELVYLLASLIGSRVSYNKIGGLILSRVNTIKKYISLIEDIYLVKESVVYDKPYSFLKQQRKIFFVDTGIANAVNRNYNLNNIPELVENAVASLVYRKNLESEINPTQYYWIETEEVDVIMCIKDEIIPIEVKYRETPSDIKGLHKFMEKFSVKKGIVVTKDLFKEEGDITYIPAWLFMLCV
ncbi:hypothetical protein MSIBF_A1670014 [groundwater metagenome]|uniref:AAA+ ATPase domain-containing protein n=1 Tax=groundwater metagenome TaxID=717931 RepID=A0A098E8A1_9ZZZZ